MSCGFNSSGIKNLKIIIIGATGSIGSVVLEAFLKEPSFTISALQRASSKSKLSSDVNVISIDESYPLNALVSAFSGQDVVVNCMTSSAVGDQKRFIDAAVEANVKRYVASEFGLNNNRPDARALNSVFREKGEIQDYLRSKVDAGLEWMSIACGMWLKWSTTHDFLGMHVKERRMVIWDEGNGYISTSTQDNTVLAIIKALTEKWEETKNRIVFLSEYAITQNELLAFLERFSGEKFTVERINSEEFIKQKKAAVEAGDPYAVYDLIDVGFASGRFGGHLEKEGKIDNDLLGLPKRSLEDIMREAYEAVN
ncbi:conserved hypothetical protein [Talaromyces stipitatus ATCC 10500]|uniref:NmrA-like domain-containing protein n=1 Tax=Talaromyces stipitatus (strain ATCC 10500 / CBS 375.48 / QM 6759 / NRRL 1006) TaxID=441959 RepID=B8M1S4_TALSN|nr:uncharacterized protein TSTA_094070 [Talaromyces stipitatus ATCC 10500]EED22161.1 conserved hypothetical protein [Talaromyces stipitatus ATCC 10500]